MYRCIFSCSGSRKQSLETPPTATEQAPHRNNPTARKTPRELTFQRRKASIKDQFQVAQLPLGEQDSLQSLCFGFEFLSSRSVARNQILENSACSNVRIRLFHAALFPGLPPVAIRTYHEEGSPFSRNCRLSSGALSEGECRERICRFTDDWTRRV
jgi:hypothetical protein